MRLVASQDIGQRAHLTWSGRQGAPGVPEKWRCLCLLSCIFSLIIETFIFQLKRWLDVAASCCTPGLWGKNLVWAQSRRDCWLCVGRRRAVRQNCRPEGEKGTDQESGRSTRSHVCMRGERAQKTAVTKPPTNKTKQKSKEHCFQNIGSFPKEHRLFFFFLTEVEFVWQNNSP